MELLVSSLESATKQRFCAAQSHSRYTSTIGASAPPTNPTLVTYWTLRYDPAAIATEPDSVNLASVMASGRTMLVYDASARAPVSNVADATLLMNSLTRTVPAVHSTVTFSMTTLICVTWQSNGTKYVATVPEPS